MSAMIPPTRRSRLSRAVRLARSADQQLVAHLVEGA
jgi:hypothetical protein